MTQNLTKSTTSCSLSQESPFLLFTNQKLEFTNGLQQNYFQKTDDGVLLLYLKFVTQIVIKNSKGKSNDKRNF